MEQYNNHPEALKYYQESLTKRDFKFIKNLHREVIHENKGTSKHYFLESAKIWKLGDKTAHRICPGCF